MSGSDSAGRCERLTANAGLTPRVVRFGRRGVSAADVVRECLGVPLWQPDQRVRHPQAGKSSGHGRGAGTMGAAMAGHTRSDACSVPTPVFESNKLS